MNPTDPTFRLAALLALGAFLCGLPGCASTYDPTQEDRSRITSVVTPGTTLRAGSRFAFLADSGTLSDRVEADAVDQAIRDAVVRNLQRRQLRYAGPRSRDAEVWVGYVAAESEDLDSKELVRRFGLAMGPDDALGDVTAGTVLVVLLDGRTGNTLWRASTQAEIRRDLPLEERGRRISDHIERLFSTCPPSVP